VRPNCLDIMMLKNKENTMTAPMIRRDALARQFACSQQHAGHVCRRAKVPQEYRVENAKVRVYYARAEALAALSRAKVGERGWPKRREAK